MAQLLAGNVKIAHNNSVKLLTTFSQHHLNKIANFQVNTLSIVLSSNRTTQYQNYFLLFVKIYMVISTKVAPKP